MNVSRLPGLADGIPGYLGRQVVDLALTVAWSQSLHLGRGHDARRPRRVGRVRQRQQLL